MNIERFHKILESYGSREENWPASERRDAQQFVEDSVSGQQSLHQSLQEYRQLDSRLDEYLPRHSPTIRQNILDNLPVSPLDSFLNWLIPEFRTEIWHPLVAGALPLVIGIAIGTNVWIAAADGYNTDYVDSWETEDVYFLALDESEIPMGLIND